MMKPSYGMAMKPVSALFTASMLATLLACSGSGSGSGSTSQSPHGNLTLLVGSDSNPDFSQIVVGMDKVELSADGTNWSPLTTTGLTFDLEALQGGNEITVAPIASLPPGNYQIRVTWATKNYQSQIQVPAYVVYPGNAGTPLALPVTSAVQGSVAVTNGGNATAILMLDAGNSVQPLVGSSSTAFQFLPAPVLFDTATAGAIHGTVSASGSGLGDQEVFAEVVDGAGRPSILRRATTDANGNFELDALPVSSGGIPLSYFLVCMPYDGASTAYPALGLSVGTLSGGALLSGQNLSFNPADATGPGNLALTVQPHSAPGDLTLGDLRQTVSLGNFAQYLIVRSDVMGVGSSQDGYTFAGLPSSGANGLYGANVTRYLAAGGVQTKAAPSGVAVNPGATTTVNLTIP